MSVRILLVDDSAADQLRVRRALERDPDTQWEVEQASTAEEGHGAAFTVRLPREPDWQQPVPNLG